MNQNSIEKYCVRIQCNKNIGSGVLINNDKTFFVLTAAHCLGDKIPNIESINIEKQNDYASEFENIKATRIAEFNLEKDFALIEIDFDDEEKILQKFKLAIGVLPETEIKFCGYQNLNVDEFRPFNGKILTVSEPQGKFKINLYEDTFDQLGEDGHYVAAGLSGSGVFTYRFKSPFLVGILNSVVTEKAWNDDIDCCSISHLSSYIEEYIDLSDFENLRRWNENIEKERTNKEIAEFKRENTDFFQKLYRKNKVLYIDDKTVDEVTADDIRIYLSMKENLRDLENNYPELYKITKNIISGFTKQVKNDHSTTVENNHIAKQAKINLERHLKDDLDKVIPIGTTKRISELQVIEWLGICTLNFQGND